MRQKKYSLNKDVADFNENGYLEGISEGTATIVVEGGGKIGTATITVKRHKNFKLFILIQLFIV